LQEEKEEKIEQTGREPRKKPFAVGMVCAFGKRL